MRILATGSNGFIGKHLCRRLLNEGHQVYGVDTADEDAEDVRHVFARYSDEEHFERIYHLACPASPVKYQRDPYFTIDTAYNGTKSVLLLAQANNARVLIASTSEVYGDPQVHPQPETYWGHVNPWGPRACYDSGKRAAEALAWIFKNRYATDVRVARIFNTYGPWMDPDDGRAVPTFARQALSGEPLTVHGDGSQTRSLCYVDDLVDGLVRLMEIEPPPDGPVNIGNPTEHSVREIAAQVLRAARMGTVAIRNVPRPIDDPERRCPDITLATKLLGWVPRTDLASGIQKTVEWFRLRLAA